MEADDLVMRKWIRQTGVNGRMNVIVLNEHRDTVPFLTRARDTVYRQRFVGGARPLPFNVSKLPEILSSHLCGFENSSKIQFQGPCVFGGYSFDTFFLLTVFAMLNNRQMRRMEVTMEFLTPHPQHSEAWVGEGETAVPNLGTNTGGNARHLAQLTLQQLQLWSTPNTLVATGSLLTSVSGKSSFEYDDDGDVDRRFKFTVKVSSTFFTLLKSYRHRLIEAPPVQGRS